MTQGLARPVQAGFDSFMARKGRHAYPRRGPSNALVVGTLAVLVAVAAPAVAVVRGGGAWLLPGVSAIDTIGSPPATVPGTGGAAPAGSTTTRTGTKTA